jgi:hypothetical protein
MMPDASGSGTYGRLLVDDAMRRAVARLTVSVQEDPRPDRQQHDDT